MPKQNDFERRYIGDGVSVQFDGRNYWLDLRQLYESEDHIALCPEVWDGLMQYKKDIDKLMEDARNE